MRHRRTPKELQRADELRSEDLDRARDSRPASRRDPVGVRTPDEHGVRAEAERLHDVAAPADAAVPARLLVISGGPTPGGSQTAISEAIDLAG